MQPIVRTRRRLAHPGHAAAQRLPARRPPAAGAGAEPAAPVARPSRQDPESDGSFEWLAAFDELDEPVFIHDRDFRILHCNPAYAAFAGQPMEAIVGRPYWQVFPKLAGPLGNCVEALRRGSTAQKSELTAAAGQVFLSHDITAHRPSGEFWYSRHMMENISARRDQEDAGRLKGVLAGAVLAGLPGYLAVVDRHHRLVHWNAEFSAYTGRGDGQLQGLPLAELVVDFDRERLAAKLDEAFAAGRAEGDARLVDGRGNAERCLFSVRAVSTNGGAYLAWLGFGRSIMKQLESDLAREKAFSDTIVESAPGPYYVVDQHANLVRWNHHLRDLTGLKDKQLLGMPILAAIHEDDRPLAAAKFLAAVAMGYAQLELRMPTATRGVRVFLKTARRFEIGGVPYVAGFCVDVTERKEAENALAKQKAFADALVNSVPGAFYVVDHEGSYYTWNSYLNRLTGLSDDELRGRSSLLTIEEKDRPPAAGAMKEAFDTGYAQAELHVLTRDRGVRLYFMTARRFEVDGAAYLVGVGVDTTDRGEHIQKLEEEARTDPLTHVANRSHFLSLAAQEFARSRRYEHPLSLWMIDVDHFKSINDSYGHHAGDVALESLAAVSRQTLRDWDVMGRMGGEEFAVLLPETDATQALLVAERLRQKVAAAELALESEDSAHLTVSIGVATMRGDDRDVECLIDRADQALLEAKRTGRDKVCVAPTAERA